MINFIKVSKDHDDLKVTIQFNREEWNVVNRFISLAYSAEEMYKNMNLREDVVKKMYTDLNELKDDVF